MTLKIGTAYKLRGSVVTLIKVFPFNPRLPDSYRVQYANGHVVDCRASDLVANED